MNRRTMTSLLVIGIAGCFTPMHRATAPAPPLSPHAGAPIDVATLAMLDPGAVLFVDVRNEREFARGHVPGALNVPVNEVAMRIEEVRILAGGRTIVVYCQAGKRADSAVEILASAGILRTRRMSGDYPAWLAAGLPIVQEPPPVQNEWRNWN